MAHENTVYIELGKTSDNLQNESYEWGGVNKSSPGP